MTLVTVIKTQNRGDVMKQYSCPKCGSKDLFLKESGNHTGLYCGDCGSWLKWVSKKEKPLVERFIEKESK